MFLLAYVPPLWFKVMDPKVIAWADGNLDLVNVLSGKREAIESTYVQQLAVAA